ncbi:MAG TPA: hypothetical protein VIC59_11600 [Gemmatimonadota bacterium]|jgi:hypothetical protein
MRRLHLVLLLGTLAGSLACSGSGRLTGPSDMSSQAALGGQEPGSRNGRIVLLLGQEPGSRNAAPSAMTSSSGSGQEPGSRN